MMLQKYYTFLQKQILLMIGLSLVPGIVYVIFGWIFNHFWPAFFWYVSLLVMSVYGIYLYRAFDNNKMDDKTLLHWYSKLKIFFYMMFFSWVIIFIINIQNYENKMHYIAIFTELGASVVAAALLVSDKKLYVPIICILMLPLTVYFLSLDVWYGYILATFSLIFLAVLLYAASNTNKLLLKNHYNSLHDILTGLYNRRYFMDYLDDLNSRLKGKENIVYIYLLDIDYFKDINNSLGHEVGDKVLMSLADRMNKYAERTHKIIRIGGDEFILIGKEVFPTKQIDAEAYSFGIELLEEIKKPFKIDNHTLNISASIGIHHLDAISVDKNTFFNEVDKAMYDAKSKGRNGVVVYSNELSVQAKRKMMIEQKLFKAIEKNFLVVHFQPQFNTKEKFIGCEALLRWEDEDLGILNPYEFINIAERSGLIFKLGIYVIEQTFLILYKWNKKNIYLRHLSINISVQQLNDIAFVENVERLHVLYFSSIKEKQTIVFEITEYAFSKNLSQVILHMRRLKELGIEFSIDDFGTGYSSLSYLQNLPIDELKIDRSFISNMNKDKSNQNIISSIISIGKNFNYRIVAEGVETIGQLAMLRTYECDIYQGFYFDAALSTEDFETKYLV